MWRYFMILNLKIESGILILRRFRGDVFGAAAKIEEKVADFEKKGTWISYIFLFHPILVNRGLWYLQRRLKVAYWMT